MPPPPTPSNIQPVPGTQPLQYNPYYMQQPGSLASPRATLNTIPYPQTSVRYGNPPAAASPRPGTPTSSQYAPAPPSSIPNRYNMPPVAGPGPPPVRPPPVVPHRTASNSNFHPYGGTPTSTKPPLPSPLQSTGTYFNAGTSFSMPTGTGLGIPTSLSMPTPLSATAPTAASALGAAGANAQKGGGRKPMSLRGAFSKERELTIYRTVSREAF